MKGRYIKNDIPLFHSLQNTGSRSVSTFSFTPGLRNPSCARLDLAAGQLGHANFDASHVEQRPDPRFIELNQQIDIGIRSRIAQRRGAEQPEMNDTGSF